jgi:hypothetical protein
MGLGLELFDASEMIHKDIGVDQIASHDPTRLGSLRRLGAAAVALTTVVSLFDLLLPHRAAPSRRSTALAEAGFRSRNSRSVP